MAVPLLFITPHFSIGIITGIQIRTMKPNILMQRISYQFSVFFNRIKSINFIVDLQHSTEIPAKHRTPNLFTQWLRNTAVNLRRADYMFTLFALLSKFNHFFNANVLAFQAIPLKMNFINQIKNASITILKLLQTFQTLIRKNPIRIRKPLNINIRYKDTIRISIKNTSTILHRRKCLTCALRATKDKKTLRPEIIRMRSIKITLKTQRTHQIKRIQRSTQKIIFHWNTNFPPKAVRRNVETRMLPRPNTIAIGTACSTIAR